MFSFPKKVKVERMSISVPAYMAEWVRKTAQENNTTISAVVAYAIRQMQAEGIRAEMIQGLIEDAANPELDAETQAWMNAPMGRPVDNGD